MSNRFIHNLARARTLQMGNECTSSGGSGPVDVIAYTDFTHLNYWRTDLDYTEAAGSTSMTVSALIVLRTVGSNTKAILANGNGSTVNSSWLLLTLAGNRFRFIIRNGTGAFINAFANVNTLDTADRLYHIVCTYDGTDIKTYVNGVSSSTDVAATGFNASASLGLSVGAYNNGAISSGGDFDMLGTYTASDYVASAAEVATWYASIVAAGRVVDPGFSSSSELLFDFSDAEGAPANFDARTGTGTMDRIGTGGTEVVNPTFTT